MQKRYKILIIDDDEINCEVLQEILEEDYQLEVAYSGEEGLEKIIAFKPDIVLLDIMMPEMNGYEVCKRIRQNSALTTIKVLLVSAKNSLKDRLIGYKAGADDYITKPIDHNELKAKINVFSRLKYSEELNKLKDDFLTLLSHESKTPLNVILGYSELLLSSTNLSETEKGFVATIIDAADQLHNKSKNTLLLGKLKKDYQLSLINGSITDIIKDLIVRYSENKKEILFQFENNIKTKQNLDAPIVSKSLNYLFENAIQYSTESDTVHVKAEIRDQFITILITDCGVGIPDDKKEVVFEEFNSDDIDHHSHGLGISLAIARRVARLHDGDLTIEDNTPTGTIFKFQISNNLR